MKIAISIEAFLLILLFIDIIKDVMGDANIKKCRGEDPNVFGVYFTWIFLSILILYEGLKIYWIYFVLK